MRRILFVIILLLFPGKAWPADLDAFPGAEGYGSKTLHAYAAGGRGTDSPDIYFINTLTYTTARTDVSGTRCPADGTFTCGTDYKIYESGLEAALEAAGAKIILFEVEGIIDTTTQRPDIEIPYMFIAGQTAPGKGIMIRSGGLRIETHNVVVQHIRVRPGDTASTWCINNPTACDALSIANYDAATETYSVVVDHCSFSWSLDEAVNIWAQTNEDIKDITISNCIISEPLDDSAHPSAPHGYAFLTGGSDPGAGGKRSYQISAIKNIIAHSRQRNPMTQGGADQIFVNNVVYNYGPGTSDNGSHNHKGYESPDAHHTAEGNLYKKGSDSGSPDSFLYVYGTVVASSDLSIYVEDNLLDETSGTTTYEAGTAWDGVEDGAVGSWTESGSRTPTFPSSTEAITVWNSEDVWTNLKDDVGAFPWNRTTVDAGIIADVEDRTGQIIDTVAEAGGWPSDYGSNTTTHTLPANPHTAAASGYTNLEEWIHAFTTTITITATDSAADEEGQATGTFRVMRAGTTAGDMVINFTLGGTASEASDVDEDLSGGTVTILNGNAFVDQTITPTDDATIEGEESLSMTISANDYIIGSPSQATIYIADNELEEGEAGAAVFGSGTGELTRDIAGTGSLVRQ